MKTQHTKGKWIVSSSDIDSQGRSCHRINAKHLTKEELEANAKLIAAAPNQQKASILLYNLCKKLANNLSKVDFDVMRTDWNIAMNSHEKAIEKATKQYNYETRT